jgi:hypothetical protein
MQERGPDGKFLSKNGASRDGGAPPEPPETDKQLKSILDTRAAHSFEKTFADWWHTCDRLFEAASDSQRANYESQRAGLRARLIGLIIMGEATDAILLGEMRKFHQAAMLLPRTPPPPLTPQDEAERLRAKLSDPNLIFPTYTQMEFESIAEELRRRPGATIADADVKSVTFSTGESLPRRALRDSLVMVGTTRLDRVYSNYPRPESYEGGLDPAAKLPSHCA